MKVKQDNDEIPVYKNMIKMLESSYVVLKNAEANTQLIQIYDKLLKYLRSLNYYDFINLIESNRLVTTKRVYKDDITDEAVESMTLNDVKKFINDPISSKKSITKIAILKFQMRNSEIKSLRNKQGLVEQLFTLINNQETHESIGRLASDIKTDR